MENRELSLLLGHLCSAVGHHVINAISTIVSQGEILRTLSAPILAANSELAERIDTIVRTAMEASTMTRRLIELSHDLTAIDSDPTSRPVEVLHLADWLPRFVEAEKNNLAPEANWVLELNPVPPIRARSDLLGTMLKLLIENALEAGAETLTITSAPAPRNWLVVELRDSGGGMPPQVMEHAIEPFFTTKPGHLGLGLTLARGIWRRHRGTLTLDSQPGQGTTVRLSAPSIDGA
ncbi:MAG: sensor histidine kinase [Isosphaeraceae bacterium]